MSKQNIFQFMIIGMILLSGWQAGPLAGTVVEGASDLIIAAAPVATKDDEMSEERKHKIEKTKIALQQQFLSLADAAATCTPWRETIAIPIPHALVFHWLKVDAIEHQIIGYDGDLCRYEFRIASMRTEPKSEKRKSSSDSPETQKKLDEMVSQMESERQVSIEAMKGTIYRYTLPTDELVSLFTQWSKLRSSGEELEKCTSIMKRSYPLEKKTHIRLGLLDGGMYNITLNSITGSDYQIELESWGGAKESEGKRFDVTGCLNKIVLSESNPSIVYECDEVIGDKESMSTRATQSVKITLLPNESTNTSATLVLMEVPLQRKCQKHAECKSSQRCEDGICVKGECSRDDNCKEGFRCIDRLCAPVIVDCVNDDGVCPGFCNYVNDNDCSTKTACENYGNISVCGLGFHCYKGKCTNNDLLVEQKNAVEPKERKRKIDGKTVRFQTGKCSKYACENCDPWMGEKMHLVPGTNKCVECRNDNRCKYKLCENYQCAEHPPSK